MQLCVPGTIGDAKQRQENKGLRDGMTRCLAGAAAAGDGHAAGTGAAGGTAGAGRCCRAAGAHPGGTPASGRCRAPCGAMETGWPQWRPRFPSSPSALGWLVPVPAVVAAAGGDRRRVALAASPRAAFPMTLGPAEQEGGEAATATTGTPQGHRPCPTSPQTHTAGSGSGWGVPRLPPACPRGPRLGFPSSFCPSMSPGSVPWPGHCPLPRGTQRPEPGSMEALGLSRSWGNRGPWCWGQGGEGTGRAGAGPSWHLWSRGLQGRGSCPTWVIWHNPPSLAGVPSRRPHCAGRVPRGSACTELCLFSAPG